MGMGYFGLVACAYWLIVDVGFEFFILDLLSGRKI
jgi:hypothetical protein